MAERIAVVTDSTADLPESIRKEAGIYMVPLSVYFGEKEYIDGVDLSTEEFYLKLATATQMPTTSQPSPGKFSEMFEDLKKRGYTHILSLHISRKLSGTIQSATVAAQMTRGVTIQIVDSKNTTWALGALIEYAGLLVKQGCDFNTLIQKVEEQIPKTSIYFTVDTLDALQRGGRIGSASALLGKLLGIRPILAVMQGKGEIEVIKKVQSTEAAAKYIAELAVKHVKAHGISSRICVLTAAVPKYGEGLVQAMEATGFNFGKITMGKIGSVIGAHAGPDAWGLILC